MNIDDSDRISGEKGITDADVRQPMRHFAGRIAHDLNNLLTPLLAYPGLIRQDIPQDTQSGKLIDVIEESAEFMAAIAERLAAFALPYDASKHVVPVDDAIRAVLAEFEGDKTPPGITFSDELLSECSVCVPQDGLMTVLRTLIMNSIEAMRGSGSLHIRSLSESLAAPLETQSGRLKPGDYVRITVRDTGPGISPDIQAQAFEPFFTTRKHAKARGAGLGLSIALSVVVDCGGAIAFDEKTEAGFAISVWLPVASDEAAEASEANATKPVPESLSVLIVDDEEPIVDLFKLMLESAIPGSHVDVAYKGKEGVEAFKARRYQIIIMDLHMPVMDGQTAFDTLETLCRNKQWDMPCVVFCTGYAPPEGVQQVIEGSSCHSLLQKPVTTECLLGAISRCLDAKR